MLCRSRVAAGGDRLSGPRERPARDAECPTSDGAACAGGAGGTIGVPSSAFLFAGAPAQAVALELNAMSIVNDAIQDRIAESGVGNDIVPLWHGDLTCDQERPFVVAVIDDLEEIASLVCGERLGSPVVEDDEVDALQRGDQSRMTSFAAGLGKVGEQAGCPLIEYGKAVATPLIAKRASKPGLPGPGWP